MQVQGPEALIYDGTGFKSGTSITGSFIHTFTKAGIYHYISEGYAHIGNKRVDILSSNTYILSWYFCLHCST